MHTTTRRRAHAGQPAAQVATQPRDARCCDADARCARCQAVVDEVRAARRDAVIHSLSTVRPRRGLR